MYYLVHVDHNGMGCISPELIVKGFKKCCVSSAVDEIDGDMLWNGSEEDGNVRSECEEDEGTAVKMETVALIGKGIESDMRCVLSV